MKRFFLLVSLLLIAVGVGLPLYYSGQPVAAPELPAAGQRVEVSPGISVNVIVTGSGSSSPIVMVHGHPGSAYDWVPLADALAERKHLAVAYDRVGYGRSDGRASPPYSLERNAAELLRLLENLDLRGATLVGWSYGGGTSIAAAKRDASRIARIVLVGSVGPGIETTAPMPAPLIPIVMGPVLSWVSRVPPAAQAMRVAISKNAFAPAPVPSWFTRQLEANLAMPNTLTTFRAEGYDLIGSADIDPSGLPLPLLVIHGRQDGIVPVSVAQGLKQRASAGRYLEVPDGGHMLPISHTALLAEAIDAFAREKAPAGESGAQ